MKTASSPRTDLHFCPVCRISLEPREMTCRECGGVPAVENVRLSIAMFFSSVFSRAAHFGANRLVVLWLLAFVPFLIGPPFLAIAMICYSVFRDRHSLSSMMILNYAAIIIVSGLNIGFSFQFTPILAEHSIAILIAAKNSFTDWMKEMFTIRLVPGGGGVPYNGGGGGRSA